MKPKRRRTASAAEPELQVSGSLSIARSEKLKRVIRQHPKRDEPKVDAIDEIRFMKK